MYTTSKWIQVQFCSIPGYLLGFFFWFPTFVQLTLIWLSNSLLQVLSDLLLFQWAFIYWYLWLHPGRTRNALWYGGEQCIHQAKVPGSDPRWKGRNPRTRYDMQGAFLLLSSWTSVFQIWMCRGPQDTTVPLPVTCHWVGVLFLGCCRVLGMVLALEKDSVWNTEGAWFPGPS